MAGYREHGNELSDSPHPPPQKKWGDFLENPRNQKLLKKDSVMEIAQNDLPDAVPVFEFVRPIEPTI
jgi:hypothetical protein